MPDYDPFYKAQGLIEQTPGGQQVYQNVLQQLNRQFGLRQRRQTMRGEQMNLPPHLRYAMAQQQFPETYGQYAGGLSRTAAAAPGIDIQKAQSLAGIQGQVEQLKLAHEQFEEQKRMQRESEKTSFWDVLGTVGDIGLGVAGLMFPPAGIAGAAIKAGTSMAGGRQPSQFSGYGAGGGVGFDYSNMMNWMNPLLNRRTSQQDMSSGGYGPWNPYASVSPNY